MNEEERQTMPKWLLPHALGVDVAFVAFVWGCVCAAFRHANVLGSGAMLLLSVAAWVCVMVVRIVRSVKSADARYAAFYRGHLSWLVLLVLCATLAALWMLFFYVGRGLLSYTPYVLLLLFWGVVFRGGLLGSVCRSLAFAVACYAPAFYYEFTAGPVLMFFSPQVWSVAGIFLLFNLHRASLQPEPNKLISSASLVGLVWLLISIYNATPGMRGFYCFMVLSLACVHFICWQVRKRGRNVSDALDWPLMGLAAVVGGLVFAPDVF